MNVSLPNQMKDWVEDRVASGLYANASDVVRDLIRREQQRGDAVAALQREIDIGRASGISATPASGLFDAVRRASAARPRRGETT